jgi:tetrahydromethanopterin S-methyltransferase subunit C
MPDTSEDPVDHARTTRQHAGETMKAGVNAPGLIAVGLGVLSVVVGLFSFANGTRTTGVIAGVIAVLLIGGGLGWLAWRHRKVQEQQQDWHRDHPEAHYEPPTS